MLSKVSQYDDEDMLWDMFLNLLPAEEKEEIKEGPEPVFRNPEFDGEEQFSKFF